MRVAWLIFLILTGSVQQTTRAAGTTPELVRRAAYRAVAIVQHGASGFYKSQTCFSCHSLTLPMMVFRTAREHGVPVDEVAAREVALKGLLLFPDRSSIDAATQDFLMLDPATDDGWALMGMQAAGAEPNLVTAIYAQRLATLQEADGHWASGARRPPQSYSLFTATALMVRTLQLHMPVQSREETRVRLAGAKKWLLTTEPRETEDYTFRLYGLLWAGASVDERRRAVRELLSLQKMDGGWSQLPHMQSDGYATGEALMALHEGGGLPTSDPAWHKGLEYLVATQDSVGAWRAPSRMLSPAPVSPPYFETGFPYDRDQFLSASGTCWGAMALLVALPRVDRPAVALPLPELSPRGVEPWMQTALFGSVDELKSKLDDGLDPNTKTAEGTTLLMMAVRDVQKIKLLLSRGAHPETKAKSGFTALTVAATYGGTSSSLKALLESAIKAQQNAAGATFGGAPLVMSVLAGDRANVSLLLSSGADVQRKINVAGLFPASALSMAVSRGNIELIDVLLDAGADLSEKDMNGMTAIHWAALGGRAEVVKLLAARGAGVNVVDNFGFTPLLYASTVDFGDARTASALLDAHADWKIVDKQGKTAWVHSSNYPYIRGALETAGARQ